MHCGCRSCTSTLPPSLADPGKSARKGSVLATKGSGSTQGKGSVLDSTAEAVSFTVQQRQCLRQYSRGSVFYSTAEAVS